MITEQFSGFDVDFFIVVEGVSLCRGLWGREHAFIGKCVSALTQPHKAFPFALLKSNSHRLCSSFTSLYLS